MSDDDLIYGASYWYGPILCHGKKNIYKGNTIWNPIKSLDDAIDLLKQISGSISFDKSSGTVTISSSGGCSVRRYDLSKDWPLQKCITHFACNLFKV